MLPRTSFSCSSTATMRYGPTGVYYYVEAKIAVLGRQLTRLFGGINFFANLALFHHFVNVDFTNAQRDYAPLPRLSHEETLVAAVCLFRFCSDRWAYREKV